MKKLENKVAIVTGASKGIGAAIAKRLAEDGAAVVVNYANATQDAETVVAEIKNSGGQAVAIQGDVSKSEDVDSLFNEAAKQFGKVDILINNAGIYEWAAIGDLNEDSFHRQFNINVLGVLLTAKAATAYMSERGGSIINIGSAVSSAQPAGSAVYTATKAAVDSITRVLSKELGPQNIRVNSINPGMVNTEGSRAAGFVGSEMADFMINSTPLKRMGEPDDVALVASFLSSDESRWLTGEILLASGGLR